MNDQLFEIVLSRPESSTLDFKATGYNFSEAHQQVSFAKDVLCMANTPRDDNAYIILGVKRLDDGTNELWGISSHADDAMMQSHVADRITPCPSFSYEAYTYGGRSFGIIQIPPVRNGPYMVAKPSNEKLQIQKLYFRRNSKNDIASTSSEVSTICEWMQNVPGISHDKLAAWDELLQGANNFHPSSKYVLISQPLQSKPSNLGSLGKIPWAMVIDFDEFSDTRGLLAAVRSELELRRSLHQIVLGDRPPLAVDRATYWFYSRGINGREKTLQTNSYKEWAGLYRKELSIQLESLAAAISPAPVIGIVLWPEDQLLSHLRTALDALAAAFGNYVQIIIITEKPGELSSIAADVEAQVIEIPADQMISGISLQFSEDSETEIGCVLPSSSGAPIKIEPKDFLWLDEELDIVHLNSGLRPEDDRQTGLDFLRGSEITWFELANHWDIDRDIEPRIARKIEEALEKKRSVRINLYHAPGAGGTTLARRLAWRFHSVFPTVILRRTEPSVTVERLHKVSSASGGRAVLLLIDGSQIEERQLDELFTLIKARQVPTVIVQVLRRFSPQVERERTFYMKNELSDHESHLLAEKLILVKPERRHAIEKIRDSVNKEDRNPFHFGLHVFEQDFLGLAPYVSHRIAGLTDIQRRLLAYIAFGHHYAQKPLKAQAFAGLLGLPQNKSVRLLRYLPDECKELLVSPLEEVWRTAHTLIALEILEQVLSGGNVDRRIWRQNLSTWAKAFAEFCRGVDLIPSDEMLEVVRRTFIYRDNADVLGTERSGSQSLSQLLEEIPSDQGRLEVLKELVDIYPDEPHFWSHLGRFYSLRLGNFQEALRCAEKAISLSPNDPVLYHMHGMILRKQIYDYIEERRDILEIIPIAKTAAASFDTSRQLNSDDEHGYISEVQMYIRLLEYAGRNHQNGVMGYLSTPNADVFLRESIQQAEDLLDQIRRQREGEESSTYELNSTGALSKLYGQHDEALQIWNNLLSRQDTYRPPLRRQIVRTYLARSDRSWRRLEKKELSRIVDLLNENISEDPTSDKDLRLWVQAIRFLDNPPSLESIVERLGYWRTNSGSLDSVYYLYVFHSLLAMDGFASSFVQSQKFLDESRQIARFRRNRTKSFEWLGHGKGLMRLVHQSELGEWDRNSEFWAGTSRLVRIQGRIEKIEGRQAGWIAVSGGIQAFFVPSRSDHVANRSENTLVDFYLGFSYDGPRAWEVRDVLIEPTVESLGS